MNDTYFDGTDPLFVCWRRRASPSGCFVSHSVHCNNAVEWLSEKKALMFVVSTGAAAGLEISTAHSTLAASLSLVSLVWSLLTHMRLLHALLRSTTAAMVPALRTHRSDAAEVARATLADLAAFHAHATAEFKLDAKRNKWVSFGGSYPGMSQVGSACLPPNLYTSVSSSAPVVAKVEMKEYNDIAARAYSLASVGGSANAALIADGHAAIGRMMNTSDGRSDLAANSSPSSHREVPIGYGACRSARVCGEESPTFLRRATTLRARAATATLSGSARRRRRATRPGTTWPTSPRLPSTSICLRRHCWHVTASPSPSPSPSPRCSARTTRSTGVSDLHRVRVLPDVRSRQRLLLHPGLNLLNDMDALLNGRLRYLAAGDRRVRSAPTHYGADRPDPPTTRRGSCM